MEIVRVDIVREVRETICFISTIFRFGSHVHFLCPHRELVGDIKHYSPSIMCMTKRFLHNDLNK